jgi:hypothetical protein
MSLGRLRAFSRVHRPRRRRTVSFSKIVGFSPLLVPFVSSVGTAVSLLAYPRRKTGTDSHPGGRGSSSHAFTVTTDLEKRSLG